MGVPDRGHIFQDGSGDRFEAESLYIYALGIPSGCGGHRLSQEIKSRPA